MTLKTAIQSNYFLTLVNRSYYLCPTGGNYFLKLDFSQDRETVVVTYCDDNRIIVPSNDPNLIIVASSDNNSRWTSGTCTISRYNNFVNLVNGQHP